MMKSTYNKQGGVESTAMPVEAPAADGQPEKGSIRIDGFNQVLEMLRAADDEFRDSLLARIEKRNPKLAHSLRQEL